MAVYYADDGMVGATDPQWLQGAFSALVAIFDRVGLRTNVGKTVSMACHPCRAGGRKPKRSGVQSEANGVGRNLCRETKIESGVRGVWGVNRGWFHVESFDDSTWEGRNTAAPLGPPDKWGAQDV